MKNNNILEKIKNTRLLAAIGLIAMLIGTMLPYISYSFWGSSLSLSLWKYWEGKVTLVLIIANAIFIFKDYIEKYIPSLLKADIWKKISEIKNPKISLIPTIVSAGLLLYLTIDIGVDFGAYGIGFYVLWIGAICLVAYAVINKGNVTVATNINNNDPNANPNYSSGMNTNINPNYNNGMNTNINPNYNNGMNTNINPNYNNGMNTNINPNYNNGMNTNINPNYNNGMNTNINPNYNNEMNTNINPNYDNGQNQPVTPNYDINMNANANYNASNIPNDYINNINSNNSNNNM